MTLNLNPESTSRKKSKNYKKTLRIGGAISLVGVGSTFAANITLNNDQNVEFGQGVAQTASCDSDGFFVNPVSYYDNTSGTFRLDYVEVSGINLIPVGAVSDTYNSSTGEYTQYSDASVVAAHPGQYYNSDNNTWTNTCDQVVLDFKAYTDQAKYSTNTLDGYLSVYDSSSATPNTISSPLFWSTNGDSSNPGVTGVDNIGYNNDFAVVFNASAQNRDHDLYWNDVNFPDSNYVNFGAANTDTYKPEINNNNFNSALPILMSLTSPGDPGGSGFVKQSSFRFFANFSHQFASLGRGQSTGDNDVIAGAISKITVESMRYFPSDYYLADENSGALGKKPNS